VNTQENTVQEGHPADVRIEKLLRDLNRDGIIALDDMTAGEQKTIFRWSRRAVDAYEKALTSSADDVRDISSLPSSVENLKVAIKINLIPYILVDLKKKIDSLKELYSELATFQRLEYQERAEGKNNWLRVAVDEKKRLANEIEAFVSRFRFS
jgi:hypothetical protein